MAGDEEERARMKIKIAVISDIHLSSGAALGRRGDIAEILLTRTVHRLNRYIRPDVTLVPGDVIDDASSPDALQHLQRVRAVLDLLNSPSIVIPGNHDGALERFYRHFEKPLEHVDINGFRFVWFADCDEPDFNARRSDADLARMNRIRAGHEGPIIALQHVPVLPPGTASCPYGYTNAEAVLDAMNRNGIGLAISGHFHTGLDPVRVNGVQVTAAPALSESPFSFLEIDIDGGSLHVRRHHLRMPDNLGLIDCHVHTQFAYCRENTSMPRAMALAKDFGLAACIFTEHSGQLYLNQETYWRGEFLKEGLEYGQGRDNRMDQYFAAAAEAGCPAGCVGLEADCDFRGRPMLRNQERSRAAFVLGAVHVLPELQKPEPSPARVADEFMAQLEQFVKGGIDSLAHPFRVFQRHRIEVPPWIFAPVVKLLKLHNVAAEVSFHCNDPSPEFFRLCIDAGVKLTFGSDTHNLYQVGEFTPHLDLLRGAGFDGNPRDVLLQPKGPLV